MVRLIVENAAVAGKSLPPPTDVSWGAPPTLSIVHAATGPVASGTGSPVVTSKPAGLLLNDLLLAHVTYPGDRVSVTPAGWVVVARTGSLGNPLAAAIYAQRSDGTDSGAAVSFGFTGSVGGNRTAVIHAFRGVDPGATPWESVSAEQGISVTVLDRTVTTGAGPPRLALNIFLSDNNVPAAAFAGETGGDWSLIWSGLGATRRLGVQSATMLAPGTINGGSYTHTGSVAYFVIGLALVGT